MVSLWQKMALLLGLSFSGCLWANDAKVYQPNSQNQWQEKKSTQQQKRNQIAHHTQNIMSVLVAEMALQKGNLGEAMQFYWGVLHESKDPAVAERLMELAINAQAYPLAQSVYEEWLKTEPKPSVAQRRIALTHALVVGDEKTVMNEWRSVLKEATSSQRKRLFLQAAQMSLVHEDLQKKLVDTIHTAATDYPDLLEAHIADVVYGVHSKHEYRVLGALQHLLKLDPHLTPPSQITLQVLAREKPILFEQFFKQHGKKMPLVWQKWQLDWLILEGKFDEAQILIQYLLSINPNAAWFIQAASLAYQMDKNQDATVLSFLEQAHHLGNTEQQSHAALMAAVYLSESKRYDEARLWIERVIHADFAWDKLIFLANIAHQQQQWKQANQYLKQATQMTKPKFMFFNQQDFKELDFAVRRQLDTPKQRIATLSQELKQARASQNTELVSQILYERGLIYSDKLQQFQLAIEDFREFLALNPTSDLGMNALGYTLLSLPQHLDEAFDLIQAAYQKNSESPQINDSLGWAYHKKGDNQVALPYLEFAHQAEPNAETAAHLGEVYWLLGRQAEAKVIWQQAWQEDKKNWVLQQTLSRYGMQLK